ncbi:MAG: type II toxin-antitoxin system PemK/MazF family toxin [Gammaproteobacteria bacterium]|nr:type II toxin-antitoxin system PemK/MazF family toxin [Gammaproteobacteria bacterium]
MLAKRGEIWWASLSEPSGSGPGLRRPIVVVQSNDFNQSRINTVIAAVVTSNLRLSAAPGNILLTGKGAGLNRDSVVNVSQLITIDKSYLTERVGRLTARQLQELDDGLRLVLAL